MASKDLRALLGALCFGEATYEGAVLPPPLVRKGGAAQSDRLEGVALTVATVVAAVQSDWRPALHTHVHMYT